MRWFLYRRAGVQKFWNIMMVQTRSLHLGYKEMLKKYQNVTLWNTLKYTFILQIILHRKL